MLGADWLTPTSDHPEKVICACFVICLRGPCSYTVYTWAIKYSLGNPFGPSVYIYILYSYLDSLGVCSFKIDEVHLLGQGKLR